MCMDQCNMNTKMILEQSVILEMVRSIEWMDGWISGIKIFQQAGPFQNRFICKRGRESCDLTRSGFKDSREIDTPQMVFDPEAMGALLLDILERRKSLQKKLFGRLKHLHETAKIEITVQKLTPMEEEAALSITPVTPTTVMSETLTEIKRGIGKSAFKTTELQHSQQLSIRNKEVLTLMTKLEKTRDIGSKLCIDLDTVNSHKKNIKKRIWNKFPP